MDWRLALAAFARDSVRVLRVARVPSAGARLRIATSGRGSRASTRICRSASPACASCSCSGARRREATRFDELNRAHLDAQSRSRSPYYALYFPAIEVLTSIALASLIVAGAHRVGIGALTVGTVAAFLQLVRRFFQPLQDLSDKFNTLQQAMAASERVFRLLDTPTRRDAGRRRATRRCGRCARATRGTRGVTRASSTTSGSRTTSATWPATTARRVAGVGAARA